MERHEFEIVLSPDGKVHVEVKGSKGKQCLELADLIREIVGIEEDRKLTSEFYGPEGHVRTQANVRQRNDG